MLRSRAHSLEGGLLSPDRDDRSPESDDSDGRPLSSIGSLLSLARGDFGSVDKKPPRATVNPFEFVREVEWDANLERLEQYASQVGHCLVPRTFVTPDGAALGPWVATQRANFKRGELSEERARRLEEVGMIWDAAKLRVDTGGFAVKGVHCLGDHMRETDIHGRVGALEER